MPGLNRRKAPLTIAGGRGNGNDRPLIINSANPVCVLGITARQLHAHPC